MKADLNLFGAPSARLYLGFCGFLGMVDVLCTVSFALILVVVVVRTPRLPRRRVVNFCDLKLRQRVQNERSKSQSHLLAFNQSGITFCDAYCMS